MPQITTRPHNVTGYAAAVVADKRRHLTTHVMLKAMQERNLSRLAGCDCDKVWVWQATPTTYILNANSWPDAREKLLLAGYDCDKRRQRLRSYDAKSYARERPLLAG